MPRLYLRVMAAAQPLEEGEGYALDVEWLIREADGSTRGAGRTDYRGLADIADPNSPWLRDPDNTVVFVPNQFAIQLACEVPGRNAAQIRRALPYAAEEYIATDIEQMHIAHGQITPGEPVLCHLIAHQTLKGWLDCLAGLGIRPGAFCLDSSVMPQDDTTASVLLQNQTALIAAVREAAVVDRDNLPFALNTLADIQTLVCVGDTLSELECGQLATNPELTVFKLGEAGVIDYLATQFDAIHALNILQGPYQPARPNSTLKRNGVRLLALASAWVVLSWLSLVVEGWWSQEEAERLEAESYALYQGVLPDESQPRSLDQLRRRVRAKLGQGRLESEGTGVFIGLTAELANAIDARSRMENLNYAEQRQELTVDIVLPNYAALDVLKQTLADSGVLVEVVNAEQEEGGARSRLRVRYAQ